MDDSILLFATERLACLDELDNISKALANAKRERMSGIEKKLLNISVESIHRRFGAGLKSRTLAVEKFNTKEVISYGYALESIVDKIKSAISSIIDFISQLWKKFYNWIKSFFTKSNISPVPKDIPVKALDADLMESDFLGHYWYVPGEKFVKSMDVTGGYNKITQAQDLSITLVKTLIDAIPRVINLEYDEYTKSLERNLKNISEDRCNPLEEFVAATTLPEDSARAIACIGDLVFNKRIGLITAPIPYIDKDGTTSDKGMPRFEFVCIDGRSETNRINELKESVGVAAADKISLDTIIAINKDVTEGAIELRKQLDLFNTRVAPKWESLLKAIDATSRATTVIEDNNSRSFVYNNPELAKKLETYTGYPLGVKVPIETKDKTTAMVLSASSLIITVINATRKTEEYTLLSNQGAKYYMDASVQYWKEKNDVKTKQ